MQEESIDNQQKYCNYREQMGRLKKALKSEFYLEAIFIEYAVMEDRLESVLRHTGKWNPKPGRFVSLDSKRKSVAKLAEEKGSIASKYFPVELTDQIEQWKEKRNGLIHALLKKNLCTEDIKAVAVEGYVIAKMLNSKVTSYNRALERTMKNMKK